MTSLDRRWQRALNDFGLAAVDRLDGTPRRDPHTTSVDGRIDGFTPRIGVYYELTATWDVDAHLVGADTLIEGAEATEDAGAPAPDAGEPPAEASGTGTPLLVVPDSRGRVADWDAVREQPFWSDVLVLRSEVTPQEYVADLETAGVEHVLVGEDHVDLAGALDLLADRGVETVLVDSGGTLNGHLLAAGLVDEVSVLVHPALVGGTSARSFVRGPDPEGSATDLDLHSAEKLDSDLVWLRYTVI